MVLSQRLQQPWLVPAPPSGLPVSVDVQQPCLLGQSSVDVDVDVALQGQCLAHLGRCVGACVDTLYVVVVVMVMVMVMVGLVELTIVAAKTKLSMVGWRQLQWQQLRGV